MLRAPQQRRPARIPAGSLGLLAVLLGRLPSPTAAAAASRPLRQHVQPVGKRRLEHRRGELVGRRGRLRQHAAATAAHRGRLPLHRPADRRRHGVPGRAELCPPRLGHPQRADERQLDRQDQHRPGRCVQGAVRARLLQVPVEAAAGALDGARVARLCAPHARLGRVVVRRVLVGDILVWRAALRRLHQPGGHRDDTRPTATRHARRVSAARLCAHARVLARRPRSAAHLCRDTAALAQLGELLSVQQRASATATTTAAAAATVPNAERLSRPATAAASAPRARLPATTGAHDNDMWIVLEQDRLVAAAYGRDRFHGRLVVLLVDQPLGLAHAAFVNAADPADVRQPTATTAAATTQRLLLFAQQS